MSSLNYNKVIIAGKLCADPEQRMTQSGTAVTTIRVAVNRRPSNDPDAQKADFFNVVAWKEKADFVAKFFHKGSSIFIEGRLQERQWTDKDGQKRYSTEIVADQVYFVDSKSENAAPQTASYTSQATASAPQPAQSYAAARSEQANF